LAHERLGWKASMDVDRVISEMCRAAAEAARTTRVDDGVLNAE
jgi:hypothetical protein